MKQSKRESFMVAFLFGILLLTVGCNMDYDGIFYQVSLSEETVEVGQIYLAGASGSTLFAYTTDVGMQSYDTTDETWSEIDTSSTISTTILPNLVSSDGNDIYFATRSDSGENNTIYTFPMSNPSIISEHSSDYDVISFAAPFDLMLTKDSSDTFYVRNISSPSTALASKSGYEAVTLLAQDDSIFLLSAYSLDSDNEKEYDYFLYKDDDTNTFTLDLDGDDEYSIRAFYVDTDNDAIVAVTSDESIYYDNNFDFDGTLDPTFETSEDTISLETTSVESSILPSLIDPSTNSFYIQGDNDYLYEIDSLTGEVEDVTDDFSASVSSFTILSTLHDGTSMYVGTSENGIFKLF